MNTLSIWRFDTADGAEVALGALGRLQTRRIVAIDDAAVVVWRSGSGRPDGYQVGTEAGTAALSGAFWGLLFGLVFLLPLAGGAGGGNGAENSAVLARVGLSDAFLAEVRARVTAGTSALFLLTDAAAVDRLREAFDDTQPLVGHLDREQEAALRRAFDADDAGDAGEPVATR